ncbi:aspartyl/asparaginyl beta-hydroxylase domain-containing protein [Oleiagrimonas sp. C23AA]|uniref:aspartyl/asparaginyl beta-hydroxylase domain-containing protein n=1 Tax=Oleiagrimonas sp. C23AA TaxID=2719047 RepID=UPI00142142C9|nr:aspartyl/asparaginyl beta-hydroxylase domain-containing protein [Oleiagrimonas sp. C23AA]NII11811.1 aspartyl/asparaginyl beta-hydroxylase domain-containing protein [Oleiagrimonas sp. C23AA]
MTLRLIILCVFALFALCVLLVHLRGRARLRFDRQLVDHSAVFAPYNLLMYAFSRVPARPILDRDGFPQLNLLRDNWQLIRDEALSLNDAGRIRAAEHHNDASFNSFFKQGWKRFYLKWYGEPLPSAEAQCPETVKLLGQIPGIKAAMFATLAPHSKLNPHRDPFAGSLRYHLGLVTPNSEQCRIFVDGQEHVWGDGKDVVFDETYVHWVENKTDQTRVILFADVERPLKTRWMEAINKRVGAFMGKITASPNDDSEKTGFVNRMFAANQRSRERRKRFKRKHPKLTRVLKYAGIVVALWVIFLCPYPFVR